MAVKKEKKDKKKRAKKVNDEGTSDLKSDEPSTKEGAFEAGLSNEDKVEEEEDEEDQDSYGKKKEGEIE